MADEIERKFILNEDIIIKTPIDDTILIKQAYLASSDTKIIRARTSVGTEKSVGYITIKSRNSGISRKEFEYEVPLSEAAELVDSEDLFILKERTVRFLDGHYFEFDNFKDKLSGLKIVEIEFKTESLAQDFDPTKYPFLGEEVSEDNGYSNHSLSKNPEYALDRI